MFNNGMPMNPMNPMQMLGNFQNFQNQFNGFAQNFNSNSTISPQQMVQNMLNSGQMSQQQFNELRMIANQITGQNR